MKVALVPKEGRYGILTVFLDGDELMEIHTAVFGRKPEIPEEFPSQKEFHSFFCKLESKQAKQYALKRVAVRSQPSAELRRNLEEKLVCNQTIEQLIKEFTHLGYLNDEEWICRFIQHQISRNVGPHLITLKLLAKGIPREMISQAMEPYLQEGSQKENIIKLLQTKYRSRNLESYHERHKIIASLIRKGFDLGEIRDVMASF